MKLVFGYDLVCPLGLSEQVFCFVCVLERYDMSFARLWFPDTCATAGFLPLLPVHCPNVFRGRVISFCCMSNV